MKRNLAEKTLLAAAVLLLMAGTAFAGESYSIRMSCSIPAIPGVNAPSVVEEKIVAAVNDGTAAKETGEDNQTKPAGAVQEESMVALVKMQTVYAR